MLKDAPFSFGLAVSTEMAWLRSTAHQFGNWSSIARFLGARPPEV